MRGLFSFLLLSFIGILVACCDGTGTGEFSGSENCEDIALAHYLTDPQRSLEIVDSAESVHALSPERADYLRAVIYYDGTNEIEKSFDLCRKLIEEKPWRSIPDSNEGRKFRLDIYRLMVTVATDSGNYLSVLKYSMKGASYARQDESLVSYEAEFLSRMGYIMYKSGQVSEGLDLMQRAEKHTFRDDSWSSYITYINNAKNMYHVYSDNCQYEEAKLLLSQVIKSLDNLRENTNNIRNVPKKLVSDSTALEEFIQYYQINLMSYLACVYADENQMDSAQYYIQRVMENPQSDNPAITKSLIHPLIILGKYDDAEALIMSTENEIVGNQINEDYLYLLKQKMKIAQLRGDDHEALRIGSEIIMMGDSLNSNQSQLYLADATAAYKLNEEHEKRQIAENRLFLSTILIVILLSTIGGVFAYFQIRRIQTKHKELRRKYEKTKKALEAITGEEIIDEDAPKSKEEIFKRAVALVNGEELFRDPEFDIVALAKMVPTNRSYLSSAINTMAQMNFRTWLANYRIEYAKKVLLEKSGITNEALAEECGFDNRVSLYRQFKSIVGMTPNEWIQSQTVEVIRH